MKNFTFEITEKWSVSKTFSAASLEDARQMAQDFQDEYDIAPDIISHNALYQGSHIELDFEGEDS